MNPICIECGEDYNPKRAELGYRTCLDCGGKIADIEVARKARCSAPAYNKGAYQYVSTVQAARGVGR